MSTYIPEHLIIPESDFLKLVDLYKNKDHSFKEELLKHGKENSFHILYDIHACIIFPKKMPTLPIKDKV